MEDTLARTPLFALHQARGGKMTPFAGHALPESYTLGVLKEHLQVREKAGLFDVSHMGQAALIGDGQSVNDALERLTPSDYRVLKPGRQRYTVLLNEAGGVVDDLMVARRDESGALHLVVNAACKEKDYAHIEAHLPAGVRLERYDDRALLALQGPKAAVALAGFAPAVAAMPFMGVGEADLGGIAVHLSRSGYTGEDGFEISVAAEDAEALAERLLAHDDIEPIGLGARDSLRLEAGLCLYGQDLNEEISPVEANIAFIIGKRRRAEGGFLGDTRILKELTDGPSRLRVGVLPEGRAPARAGTEIQSTDGKAIGAVTSGGFGPSVSGPISMGYVDRAFAGDGAEVQLLIRGKPAPAKIAPMPFAPHRFYRG